MYPELITSIVVCTQTPSLHFHFRYAVIIIYFRFSVLAISTINMDMPDHLEDSKATNKGDPEGCLAHAGRVDGDSCSAPSAFRQLGQPSDGTRDFSPNLPREHTIHKT